MSRVAELIAADTHSERAIDCGFGLLHSKRAAGKHALFVPHGSLPRSQQQSVGLIYHHSIAPASLRTHI